MAVMHRAHDQRCLSPAAARHYAIRTLMADTAAQAGHNPDRVSFVAALRVTRRSIAHQGDFPPSRD
jgi:hypothetical protein